MAQRSGRRTRERWVIIALCFLGTSINYVDQANLSVAAPFISREFNLGPEEMA